MPYNFPEYCSSNCKVLQWKYIKLLKFDFACKEGPAKCVSKIQIHKKKYINYDNYKIYTGF